MTVGPPIVAKERQLHLHFVGMAAGTGFAITYVQQQPSRILGRRVTMITTTISRTAIKARGLMTANPVSINEHATLQDAAALLTKRNISAAPVINDAGRPVGVLSRTDIIRSSSGVKNAPQMLGDFINEAKDQLSEPTHWDSVSVRQVMTPVVLSIGLHASLAEVCEKMLDRKVHRLFVIDEHGILVGVISALDVLRCLTR
jgi:CBS domain-containing protein